MGKLKVKAWCIAFPGHAGHVRGATKNNGMGRVHGVNLEIMLPQDQYFQLRGPALMCVCSSNQSRGVKLKVKKKLVFVDCGCDNSTQCS